LEINAGSDTVSPKGREEFREAGPEGSEIPSFWAIFYPSLPQLR